MVSADPYGAAGLAAQPPGPPQPFLFSYSFKIHFFYLETKRMGESLLFREVCSRTQLLGLWSPGLPDVFLRDLLIGCCAHAFGSLVHELSVSEKSIPESPQPGLGGFLPAVARHPQRRRRLLPTVAQTHRVS